MLVFIDDRKLVLDVYSRWFDQEGMFTQGFSVSDFLNWLACTTHQEMLAIEGILVGEGKDSIKIPAHLNRISQCPVIAVVDTAQLEIALELFGAGFDDVIRKPIQVREILARIYAKKRCAEDYSTVHSSLGPIRVYFDGRAPQINGMDFSLPHKERRILEYLVFNQERRVTKTQLFNALYGFFESEINEITIESHISKLRRKLKSMLGFDPIKCQRFLGYTISMDGVAS